MGDEKRRMTDDSPTTTEIVVKKNPGTPHKVKIDARGEYASIRSKDGAINMRVLASMVRKKFAADEEPLGYFQAHLRSTGTLDIGDRLPDQGW